MDTVFSGTYMDETVEDVDVQGKAMQQSIDTLPTESSASVAWAACNGSLPHAASPRSGLGMQEGRDMSDARGRDVVCINTSK